MIRHFVHLRFDEAVPEMHRRELFTALAGLADHIDGILDMQDRTNVSPERDLVRGFDHVFWLDFRDASARDTYLADPHHLAIAAQLLDAVGGPEGIFVCDMEM
ncbi:stress responsive alpha/beta barrel protein [Palleronia aestuarii]|uniref:Stress responsive alpha/beta barrel protein n=1 Tax=Palleronia aestuarii TaxID=568105 RepID=A0A2W7P5U5_9RHOB|nr:Dabb family protein [Palleronia aestuarii]PZX18782.1 stress responsive alpha/beta barrel protein [Palleronia aestuarii]